jgi:hypothetical protein
VLVCAICIGIFKPEYDRAKGGANVTTHPDYAAEYENVEEKAFAAGGCGAAWKIKKRNSDD